jgi:hypothetical protein
MKKISGMNFAHITEDVAGLGSGGDITHSSKERSIEK